MTPTLSSSSELKPASTSTPAQPSSDGTPDEPSLHGIEGIDRMRIIRDDIATRVSALAAELTD
jgi:hypothetical protein